MLALRNPVGSCPNWLAEQSDRQTDIEEYSDLKISAFEYAASNKFKLVHSREYPVKMGINLI